MVFRNEMVDVRSKVVKDIEVVMSSPTPSPVPTSASVNHYSPSTTSSTPYGHHSPVPSSGNHYSVAAKISGVPCPATPTRYTAPVHIDVGGVIYTSSLETLTKFPESRLGRMFNGSIPIVLDSLKQHYFIDRDGKIFRYILNYLRSARVVLPENFDEYDLLYQEAKFYDLHGLVKEIEMQRQNRKQTNRECTSVCSPTSGNNGIVKIKQEDTDDYCECVVVHISPDLGERVCLTAERALVEEIFPELTSALMDSRNSGFNMDNRYVIRFPVNGFCKLNSLQVLQRLMSNNFQILASNGGGVEGQQFSEYLFGKKVQVPR
ncbi:BTB/POZ domain-containing protein kctd15-like [Tubulanus polymorphus]|uniref:BTB/POZ domain-containing protein kctd15-like n=1 Tax=Tubulanus polymorphus TaxID=672921 RepID=UPI003DA66BA7